MPAAVPREGQGLLRRHIAAVTLGNALEFYDFLTFSFFAIQIGHAFFPSNSAYGSLMGSLATFGAGFATRPLGAIVIGRYADRVGRKPAMLLSFVLIGASIFGMALIPPYAAIGLAAPVLAVIARMLQGFSLGGEIGSNTAFLLEAAPPQTRGLIVSWQGASQMIAILVGSLVGVLLSSLLPANLLCSVRPVAANELAGNAACAGSRGNAGHGLAAARAGAALRAGDGARDCRVRHGHHWRLHSDVRRHLCAGHLASFGARRISGRVGERRHRDSGDAAGRLAL